MNRIHTSLAIACLCAAVVGWQIWAQKSSQELASNAGPSPSTALATSAIQPADTDLRAVVPAQRTEQALGFRVLKDRKCEVEIHYIADPQTGETHEAMSCKPLDPNEPHPYESWSDESLAGMAYGDSKAAEILGLRHIGSEDPAEETLGLSFIYRSVALSGDPSTFRRAIGVRYGHVSVNDEPQIENLKQLLVFNVMGEALGDERFNAGILESELRSADIAEEEILRLRAGSENLLRKMADLQAEITGSLSIREALENA